MSLERHVGRLLAGAAIGLIAWNALASDKYGMPALRAARGVLHPPHIARVGADTATISYSTVRSTAGGVAFGRAGRRPTTIASGAFGTQHRVRLDGLAAGQIYTYRVLVDGQAAGKLRHFKTDPGPTSTIRAVVLGDTGSGSSRQQAIASRLLEMAPDLVLHTGDLAYPNGTLAEVYSRFVVPFADARAQMSFYATVGNHDVKTDNARPMLDAMVLPTNGFEPDERTYVKTFGALRFVCIDTERSLEAGSPQHRWLDEVLAERDPQRWTVVFGHRAVWPGSRSGGAASLQKHLVPLLDRHGVDLYLSGHDHVYMRTHPMRAGKVLPQDSTQHGVVYLVSGGGGKSLYEIFDQPHNAVALKADHVVELTVRADTLTAHAIAPNGTILDTFELTR